MIALEQLETLLYDTAAALGAAGIGPVDYEENVWCLEINEQYPIEVVFDAEKQALALAIPVTRIPEDNRQRIFDTLLSYNNLWRDSGGFWLAISADGEWINQLIELHAEDLDENRLTAVIVRLVENTQSWETVIARLANEDDAKAADHSAIIGPGGIPIGAIRG